MSKLLEYEVKELLSAQGVAVPDGVVVRGEADFQDAAALPAGPYYVKAQIASGDRAAAGGVEKAVDLESARAAAARMLGSTISSQRVDAVLIECGVDVSWEGYASVVVVENPPRRVLYFSTEGGAGFDPSQAPIQMSLTDDDPHGFRIRRELRQAGLPSEQLAAVTAYLIELIRCAQRWCTYTIETNPVTFVDGRVVALDAKADLDDYSKALIPRPSLLDRADQDPRERAARDAQNSDHRGSLRYVQLVPEGSARGPHPFVASHSVGGGESMVVLDALAAAGLAATNYCDTSGSPSAEKVATGARLVAGQAHVDGLFFSTCIANQPLSVTANGLVAGWEDVGWRGPTVVRFAGNQSAQARQIVGKWAVERSVPIVIVGEETDEWEAASALSELIDRVERDRSA